MPVVSASAAVWVPFARRKGAGGRPHRDHVAGPRSSASRQDHRPGRGRLTRRQRCDEEDRDRDHERPLARQVAEGGHDRVLVVGDEGVAIQAIPRKAIIATMPERKICVPGMSALDRAEQHDQRRGGQHHHLDDRRHRERLEAAALGQTSAAGPWRSRRCRSARRHRGRSRRTASRNADHDVGGRSRRGRPPGREPLRWYSASSSRSRPCRLITNDIAGMPMMLAGIVIRSVDELVVVDLDEREDRRHRGRDQARRDPERRGDRRAGGGRSGRILFAYETSLITGMIE